MSDRTITIVDDHEGARQSLRALLEAENFQVKEYASAVCLLADTEALRCECLLTDIRMPEMDGLALFQELKKRGMTIPVIVLTGHGDVPLAVSAIRAGVFDFIEKPYNGEALLESLARALSTGQQIAIDAQEAAAASGMIQLLTERERQVFDRLVMGKSNKLVAHELGISPRTVEIHRAQVTRKMKARSLSDLVRAAHSCGILAAGAVK